MFLFSHASGNIIGLKNPTHNNVLITRKKHIKSQDGLKIPPLEKSNTIRSGVNLLPIDRIKSFSNKHFLYKLFFSKAWLTFAGNQTFNVWYWEWKLLPLFLFCGFECSFRNFLHTIYLYIRHGRHSILYIPRSHKQL